jgi:VanZ family protein
VQFNYLLVFRILFWLALIGSYIFALVPQDIAPKIGSLSDKSIHFIAFAVLTLLLRFAYSVTLFQTFLLLLMYAVFIEFSQLFTPNRSAEILDIVADIIGIGIGLLFYPFIKKLIMGYIKNEHY